MPQHRFLPTHGMAKTRLYRCWIDMKQRCEWGKHKEYHRYGGRGISVCNEWKTFESFMVWAMSNGYEDNLTIERIDNNKGYTPENCRWATRHEQSHNTNRNVMLTYNGETKCLSEWSRQIGLSPCTVKERIDRGMSIDEVIETPKYKRLKKSQKRGTSNEIRGY